MEISYFERVFRSLVIIARIVFGRKYLKLNNILLKEGIAFNWKPIWENACGLTNKEQKRLGKLIAEYIYGRTANIHNEYGFMYSAVKAFLSMKDHSDQEEFERRITHQNKNVS